MIKVFYVLFLFFGLLPFKKCFAQQDSSTGQLNSFVDNYEKVSFFYPKKWNVLPKTQAKIFTVVENKLSNTDKFSENISLSKISLRKGHSLEFLLNSAGAALMNKYKDGVIISKVIKKNSRGLIYGEIKSLILTEGIKILLRQVYFQRQTQIFVLSLLNNNLDNEKYSKIFDKVIDKFQFL